MPSDRKAGEWGEVFGDAVVATAILDRLLHHRHVLTITGELPAAREASSGRPQVPAPTPLASETVRRRRHESCDRHRGEHRQALTLTRRCRTTPPFGRRGGCQVPPQRTAACRAVGGA